MKNDCITQNHHKNWLKKKKLFLIHNQRHAYIICDTMKLLIGFLSEADDDSFF